MVVLFADNGLAKKTNFFFLVYFLIELSVDFDKEKTRVQIGYFYFCDNFYLDGFLAK